MFLTRLAVVFLLTFSASTSVMAGPTRIVQKPVPGGFKITIVDFIGGDHNAAQVMIAPTVRRLCGELEPRWGRFTLKAMVTAPTGKALKPGRFEQNISCVAPPAAEPNIASGPFTATAVDEDLVRTTALRFLSFRDVGRGLESFAMLAPSMKETTDQGEWIKNIGMNPQIVGKSVERRITKVTWYIDPPGVSSGVYAAADFDGHSTGLAIHCGYVALKRQTSGEYLIVRLEEGRLAQEEAKGLAPDRRSELRSNLQCRD
jgi:Protein of unknown function (DUF4019)